MTGILLECLRTFMIIPCRIHLRIVSVSDKSCRENQNTNFVFNNPFPQNRAVYEVM
jgi:hypothetical protein